MILGFDGNQFVALTINGLANGAILAITALGFVLIYKATETVSFAPLLDASNLPIFFSVAPEVKAWRERRA